MYKQFYENNTKNLTIIPMHYSFLSFNCSLPITPNIRKSLTESQSEYIMANDMKQSYNIADCSAITRNDGKHENFRNYRDNFSLLTIH